MMRTHILYKFEATPAEPKGSLQPYLEVITNATKDYFPGTLTEEWTYEIT